jgi:hypothetical protein
MKYYMVLFSYPGPFDGTCSSPEADEALSLAEKHVETVLKGGNIHFKHAYSWPDGSLYKYVQSELCASALWAILLELFRVSGGNVSPRFPDELAEDYRVSQVYNPKTGNFKDMTVAEFMAFVPE